ncbi:transposase [Streptomyces brasiliscabiei]|uniref:transposase n=1 Tax=Streptomyces brasiliscabiei TaxID=2736302 RepID=UPI001C11E254|nr:transposase [Streptomyces brasiliscabiei]
MGKLSYGTAINYLRKIFNGATSDYVGIETAYRHLGLSEGNSRDRDRLYEWLKSMEEQGLVKKEYTEQRRIKGLQLTSSGQLAMRSMNDEETMNREARLARWRADAEALQTLYPDFEIIYDIRLRKNGIYQEPKATNRVAEVSASRPLHKSEPLALVEAQHHDAVDPAPSDLTDDEWGLLVRALTPDTPGMKRKQGAAGTRRALNGMLYRHDRQTTWAQVPRRYGNYGSIQIRYSNYRRSGIFTRTLAALDSTPGAERLVEWLRHVEGGRPTTSDQRDRSAA